MTIDPRHLRPAPGRPTPPGATPVGDGVNFCLPAPDATAVDLVLFAGGDDPEPRQVIRLTAPDHLTDGWWHVRLTGAGHGQVYGWRVAGEPRLLLDPWARAVVGLDIYERDAARLAADNTSRALRAVVVDPDRYDWEEDAPPAPAPREVIYEMHVAAFTRDPTSGVAPERRGTYAGVAERAAHLRELGVTTVELMPVQAFDPQDAPPGRVNYWGYSPVAWSAPHGGWAADRSPTGPVDEFRDMVKALHRAGLRVVLDVVFNHTAEGESDGPTLSWRGLGEDIWYQQDPATGDLIDHTGCGNTVNANGALPRGLVLDSLRWWTEHLHVDGFRFDLASALARGAAGQPLTPAPLLEDMRTDGALAGRRLILEPWDVGGLSLVGKVPGDRFAVWNGPFRDDVRSFWRGDDGTIEGLMARLVGSPDMASDPADGARQVINFVTAHDGFCLTDLVSYNRKDNAANGENNHDGSDHNLSWNSGHEGPDAPAAVLALRRRRARSFLATLLLSHGTPMLLMGDEMGATRRGNNNPWCQDNDLNWLDWTLAETSADLLRFTRELIRFTSGLAVLRDDRYWHASSPDAPGDITWHGRQPDRPDWRPTSHCLAWTLETRSARERVHIMANAGKEAVAFAAPDPRFGPQWRLVLDTASPPPADIHPRDDAPAIPGPWEVLPYGLMVLLDADS